jgi:3',5'-cyclic AMP phosphodiesterase CpdA
MVRIAYILAAVILSLCTNGIAGDDVSSKGESFRFAIISDRNGGNIPGLWTNAIEEINLLKPEFVMSVGDFIAGYSEDANEVGAMWDAFLAENSKFEAPFYFVPGNHDETNATMQKIYRERIGRKGRSYYSFSYGGCDFIVLDSNLFTKEGMDAEQLAWLKEAAAHAKEARHTFIFYHHPANEKSAAWKQLSPLFASAKTTIFNGHIHTMSYARQDGFDTYTLPATAAQQGQLGPELGDAEMFAFVTVKDSEPTVAMLTVGQVRSGKQVDRKLAAIASSALKQLDICQEPTPTGRRVTVTQPNTSASTFAWNVGIVGSGYEASSDKKMILKPQGKASATLDVSGWAAEAFTYAAPYPGVKCTYTFKDGNDKEISMSTETAIGRFSVIERVPAITVDGKLDDWVSVKPEVLPPFGRLLTEGPVWVGNADFYAEVKLASDGNNLYVAVSVKDDDLRTGLTPATANDGWALAWSVPASLRTGDANSPMAGTVRLIPAAGKVEPIWSLPKRLTRPAGFKAVSSRTGDGYVCEMAMPYSDIGTRKPNMMNWRIQFRDIDKGNTEAEVFTIGGILDAGRSPESWITGVIR